MVRAGLAVLAPPLLLSSTGLFYWGLRPMEAVGVFFVAAIIIFYVAILISSNIRMKQKNVIMAPKTRTAKKTKIY